MSFEVNKTDTIAIVGASNNPEKYGNKIAADLKAKGFKIIPVNLKEKEILGLPVHAHLADIEETIDIVDFVVPPAVSLKVLEEVKKLGLQKVWFQPGSSDERVLEFCKQHNLNFIANACLMRQTD